MNVPPGQAGDPNSPQAMPTCPRHPDRPTGLSCTRCGRPACPECLRDAAVGQHCVDCVKQAERTTRRPVTVAGAPLRSKPVLVPGLIAVNVLIYVFTAVQAGSAAANSSAPLFQAWWLMPAQVAGDQWWRVFTSAFLHFGLIHLLINMIALWVVGRDLELLLGRLRFAAVYLLSLLGGSMFVFLFDAPFTRTAGASAALYGLFGGLAVAAWRLKLNIRPILLVIGLNVVLTITIPNISLLGHLGGLVLGALSTAALLYAPAARRNRWQAGGLAAVFLVIVAAMLTRDAMLGGTVCDVLQGRQFCVRTN
ncbi:rhomboid family intramembrane serine protease [Actinopolyspora mzabensis]|uniref:rhomboid family intramembrane serine protease n=1 Tax=Actinopolyspora mzabensis TaxID=995066 RepID=UPI000AEF02E4|nr:rhomboid family intramembrane serine protease [Actinopolyspora mzabensis]